MPVPSGMMRLPKALPSVWVADTTLPHLSATTKCVVWLSLPPDHTGGSNGFACAGSMRSISLCQYASESSSPSGGRATSGSPA